MNNIILSTYTEDPLKDLHENGFFILKHLFKEDLPDFREILEFEGQQAYGGKTVPGVFHRSNLSEQIIDPLKLREASNTIFKHPFFTGHSDLHQNIRTGWHRDDGTTSLNRDGYFGENRVGFDEVLVVKFATYLENNDRYSGLWVFPGSHRERTPKGKSIFIRCAYPDAIVFDVRLIHRGNSRFSLAHVLKKKRTSIFFTIGENCPLSRIFADKNWERQELQSKRTVSNPLPFIAKIFN